MSWILVLHVALGQNEIFIKGVQLFTLYTTDAKWNGKEQEPGAAAHTSCIGIVFNDLF